MLEKILNHKILLLSIIASLNALMYGIEVWRYSIYNIDSIYYYKNALDFTLDPYIQMMNSGAHVLNAFLKYFQILLQIPFFYLISSVAIKISIFYILYLIINELVNEKRLAFIVAIFFITAVEISGQGVVMNGFWGAPMFYRASFSGLMTLIGLYYLIKRNYFISSIPFVLSLHLHLLYGATAFAFIFFSFLFLSIKRSYKDVLKLIGVTLFIGLNVVFIIMNIDSSLFEIVLVDIKEWYKVVYANDPEDMTVLFPIGSIGYFIIPFISMSVYFVINKKDNKVIDYLFLGSIILFALILLIEILHYNSVFFGFISENFIGIQFRRGLWVVMLFSTIINFLNIQHIISRENKNQIIYFLIACCFLFLKPNVIIFYVLALLSIIFFKQKNIIYMFLLSSVLLIIGVDLGFYHFRLIPEIINSAFILLSTFFISLLYRYKKIKHLNILFSIVLFFIIARAGIGIARNTLINDLKLISNNGFFSYPNIVELDKEIYKSQGKIINNKIIDFIRKNNDKKEFVLESMDNLFYGDAIIYNSPIYLSRTHLGYLIYSKIQFGNFLFRLNQLGIQDYSILHKGKINSYNLIDKKIQLISREKWKSLYINNNIRFVILKHELNNYIVSENGYYLYDLKYLK